MGLCFEGVRQDRALGDKALCTSTQPLGRIVIGENCRQPCCCMQWYQCSHEWTGQRALLPACAGLYGRALPQTVSNFLTLVKSGAYSGTAFTKACPRHPTPRSAPQPLHICASHAGAPGSLFPLAMWQVLPGEYVQLGKQGSPRQGLVKPPTDLPPNTELLASRSFRHALP